MGYNSTTILPLSSRVKEIRSGKRSSLKGNRDKIEDFNPSVASDREINKIKINAYKLVM